eukprot:15457180-Alexandrium_andersonii.AAC.1
MPPAVMQTRAHNLAANEPGGRAMHGSAWARPGYTALAGVVAISLLSIHGGGWGERHLRTRPGPKHLG